VATKALAGRFAHIVLTVNTIEATVKFYERAHGFKREVPQGSDWQPRYALRLGEQVKPDIVELNVLADFSFDRSRMIKTHA